MVNARRLAGSLLTLRLSVFLVMFMWSLDKLVNPEHARGVFEHFYGLSGLGSGSMMALGSVELALLAAFVSGLWKRWTYGAVLVFHAVSTLSTFRQYLSPWEAPTNLLFYAAWPMLAACVALYVLRDDDVLLTIKR